MEPHVTAIARGRRAAYPADPLIHRLIEQQAAQRPDKPAVVFDDTVLSYGELNRRANRLAAHLRTVGAGSEVRIGVCLRRSPDAVVAMLGIVKSGAAPVLIDHALPNDRIGFILRDADARAVVTSSGADGRAELLRALATEGVRPVLLDRERSVIDAQPDTNLLDSGLTPDSAAHVVYTSGSSGVPKGVIARHETVLQCVHWAREAFSISADDRSTWVSSPGFGVSLVNELWPFLAAGCTVHLPDEETLLFPDRLRDWLIDNEITVVQLVKTLAQPLCAVDWPAECPLRLLLATGERFESWPSAGLPFDVAVTYGSTETTHITSWLDMAAGVRVKRRSETQPPVGWPVANASVYLLDEHGAPVAAGAAGQIYVAGPGIARGYLGDPALTAAHWLPDRFADVPGARMYRTGDLGELLADGSLRILGRVDRQVKIRGKRANLDEVETVLSRRTEVAEAAVTAHGEGADRRLVAYLAGVERGQVPALHAGLAAELPDHLVPSDFILLAALPRTTSGKLDRQALPAPRRGRMTAAPMRATHGAVEVELTEIWRELLCLDEIGVADDFFELGGHSLIAAQVITAVEERLGARIDLPAFYQRPTISHLAAMVEAWQPSDGEGVWLVYPKPSPRARVRLVCFPFAGGGPTAFASWPELLPAEVELCWAQPPGRGARLAEKPLDRLDQLVRALGTELVRTSQLPTAFFGHSLGAVVAFELARWLRQHGHLLPVRLFVSGSAAPQIPVTTRVHQMSDDALVAHVRELGGAPRDLLDDPRLRQVVLPALRADFAMHETYSYAPDAPLACPITAFGGTEDSEAMPEEIRPWHTQTSVAFDCHLVSGGHFYLHSAREELLGRILGDLAPLLDSAEVAP